MNLNRALAKALLSAGILTLISAAPLNDKAAPSNETKFQGITVPSERLLLSLKLSDVVWKVDVKPGDKVTKGQLLISEDTREEEVRLKIIKLEADSEVGVKAAEAALESAKVAIDSAKVTRDSKAVEYDRYQKMGTAANPSEIEKARLDLELAKLEIVKADKDVLRAVAEIEKAKVDVGQKKLQVEMQATVIERMQIRSPVNGIVEEIMVHKGEVVDPQKPAMIVVNNETLWAEVYIPAHIALGLQPGQPMQVVFTGLKDQPKVIGKVVYLSPVVDATADKRLVRVEVDNRQDQRPAGLAVEVTLPDATAKVDK